MNGRSTALSLVTLASIGFHPPRRRIGEHGTDRGRTTHRAAVLAVATLLYLMYF